MMTACRQDTQSPESYQLPKGCKTTGDLFEACEQLKMAVDKVLKFKKTEIEF